MDSKYMFCPNCGHKVEKSRKFCAYCGHQLHDNVTRKANHQSINKNQPQSTGSTKPQPNTPQPSRYSRSNVHSKNDLVKKFNKMSDLKKSLIGLGVCVVLVGFGAGGINWYQSSPNSINLNKTLSNHHVWHSKTMSGWTLPPSDSDTNVSDVDFYQGNIKPYNYNNSDTSDMPNIDYYVKGKNLKVSDSGAQNSNNSDLQANSTSDGANCSMNLKLDSIQDHAKKLFFKITSVSMPGHNGGAPQHVKNGKTIELYRD